MIKKSINLVMAASAFLASANAFATGSFFCSTTSEGDIPVRLSGTYSWSSYSIVSDIRVAVGKVGHESLTMSLPQANIVNQAIDDESGEKLFSLRVMDSDVMTTWVRIKDGEDLKPEARIFEINLPQTSISTQNFVCRFR